jgi:hypothetical protein
MTTHVIARLTASTALSDMNKEDTNTLGEYDILVHADVPHSAIVSAAKDVLANDVPISELDDIDITIVSHAGDALEEDLSIESYSWNDMAKIECFEPQFISLPE